MSASCGRIGALVMKIQNDFLDTPGLTLTLSQAEKRYGTDATTCEAVLSMLTDARVLARTSDDAYIRFFPRVSVPPHGSHIARRQGRTKTALATGHPIADFAA